MKAPSARLLCFAAACLLAALPLAVTPSQAAPPIYIEHQSPPGSTPLPFSDAVRVGDTLYVAGHLGIDPHTGNAVADPGAEARAVMEAVKHTVEAAGFKMDDLVSVTVYCTDLGLYDTFNATYRGYFHGHFPARAFIGAGQLLRGAHFEVAAVGVRPAPPASR
jgi:2-iminobutanoate/2-iminopropanoate deaminase